jgi:hypothetical protein
LQRMRCIVWSGGAGKALALRSILGIILIARSAARQSSAGKAIPLA